MEEVMSQDEASEKKIEGTEETTTTLDERDELRRVCSKTETEKTRLKRERVGDES